MSDELLDLFLHRSFIHSPNSSISVRNNPSVDPCMEYLDIGVSAYRSARSEIYDNPNDLIPTNADLSDELATKAQRVSDVIEEGTSLALTTNKLLTTGGGRTPEQIACSIMTLNEFDLFEAWKGGLSLPPIDIKAFRKVTTASAGKKDVKTRLIRGQAMNRLYSQSNLDEEHYLWFASHYGFLMPLVTAIIKLLKAERNVNQGDPTISQLDVEECQTINRLFSAFTSRQVHFAKYKMSYLNHAIHRMISLATARKAAIHMDTKKSITSPVIVKKTQEYLADTKTIMHEDPKREAGVVSERCSKKRRL